MELKSLVEVLEMEAGAAQEGGTTTWRAQNLPGPGQVVFGGQMLAQSVVAATALDPAKEIQSISTVFARGGRIDQPLDIDVVPIAKGRTFSSATVTVRQGDRRCAESLVLLTAPDPDRIRHQPEQPAVTAPTAGGEDAHSLPGWEMVTVGDVDIQDPEAIGPAELQVWSRFPDAPRQPGYDQALLSYASEGFLIATAMRPHAGIGQALAHVSVDTSVIGHQLVFHEPFDATDWLLLAFESQWAGRGRSYGRGQVFATDGRLVASISQQNMIRAFPARDGVQP